MGSDHFNGVLRMFGRISGFQKGFYFGKLYGVFKRIFGDILGVLKDFSNV